MNWLAQRVAVRNDREKNDRISNELFGIFLEPYMLAQHSYIEALFTFKLGLGYITGVIEFVLGGLIYIMCLPFVRKTGHFQVQNFDERSLRKSPELL